MGWAGGKEKAEIMEKKELEKQKGQLVNGKPFMG